MALILLLNVMELLSVVGGALLDRPCMVFHRMCVLCLWSICFVCVFVCRNLSHHLVWEMDLLMLLLCVILHTMSLGKSLQLLCILPFGVLCLSAISMMFVKIMLAVCILLGLSESGLCVFRELCPVIFLVVSACPSVLL